MRYPIYGEEPKILLAFFLESAKKSANMGQEIFVSGVFPMDGTDPFQTRPSLFARFRRDPDSRECWTELIERYSPLLFAWCRKQGLQEADAQDLTQDVLLNLPEKLKTYDASRRFRTWLRTVLYHACCDFWERRNRAARTTGGGTTLDLLQSRQAQDDFFQSLEDEDDQKILHDALDQVRLRVQPATWQAFFLSVLEENRGEEVARTLGITVENVHQAAHRVRTMLHDLMKQMKDDD